MATALPAAELVAPEARDCHLEYQELCIIMLAAELVKADTAKLEQEVQMAASAAVAAVEIKVSEQVLAAKAEELMEKMEPVAQEMV